MENKYELSFFETLTMAAGFTIGSGIVTQLGYGIALTGRSILLAIPLSAFLFLISYRPLFILSGVLPHVSAAYYYSKTLISQKVGGFFAYVYFLGRLTIAIFGISFAQYLAGLFPVFAQPGMAKLAALAILTLFFIVNLLGMKTASKVQNIMFLIMVCGLLSYVFFGIGKIDMPAFFADDFFTGGVVGFYDSVSLFFFAVSGSYIITDFAPKIKNAKKVVLRVILTVTVSVCVLYMLMAVVASGSVAVSEAAGRPLTVSAQKIFPNGILYTFFVVCACIGALLTTLNSSFIWYSNSLTAPCEDGWLPRALTAKNKYGASYRLMIIFYLFGAIPTLLGIDLAVISKMAIGLTIISSLIPMLGLVNLPEKYPVEWNASKYAGKYSRKKLIIMVALSYTLMGSQVIALFAGNPAAANIIIGVYVSAVVIFLRFVKK